VLLPGADGYDDGLVRAAVEIVGVGGGSTSRADWLQAGVRGRTLPDGVHDLARQMQSGCYVCGGRLSGIAWIPEYPSVFGETRRGPKDGLEAWIELRNGFTQQAQAVRFGERREMPSEEGLQGLRGSLAGVKDNFVGEGRGRLELVDGRGDILAGL
jgi:hypothetical protein